MLAAAVTAAVLAGCGGGSPATVAAASDAGGTPAPPTSGVITGDDASFLHAGVTEVYFFRWTETSGVITGKYHYAELDANHATGTKARSGDLHGHRDRDVVRLTLAGGNALTGVLSGRGHEAVLTIAASRDDGQLANLEMQWADADEYNQAVGALSSWGKGNAQAQDDAAFQAEIAVATDQAYATWVRSVETMQGHIDALEGMDRTFRRPLARVASAVGDVRDAHADVEREASKARPDCWEVSELSFEVGSRTFDLGSRRFELDSATSTVLGTASQLETAVDRAQGAFVTVGELLVGNPSASYSISDIEDVMNLALARTSELIDPARAAAEAALTQAEQHAAAADDLNEDASEISARCDS